MAVKIMPEEFSLLIRRLNTQWCVLAPSAEYRGGRFADTDNIIYQQIRGWDDLVWQEKSHMSPNKVISPITETLFYFNGFAPIFPDICYHLTHYKPAAADIPVASDNPAHYADA
ncbi:hypothetical protein R0787_22335, partial [Escherichia albertii]